MVEKNGTIQPGLFRADTEDRSHPMPTTKKKKTAPKVYGPTSRPYGRLSFASLNAAAAWCAKHPAAWFAINKRPSGRVVVKRMF
jgi:hypothetical protein